MGCINAVFGFILPRFVLLVGWYNDPEYWNGVLGSQLALGIGWLFLPWTTLIYGFGSANGMSTINWIFTIIALLLDLGTYSLGFFGGRKEYSAYRDR
ncbi:MAG: hypothetical protein ACJ765_14955 [Chloroflexota bacterium]